MKKNNILTILLVIMAIALAISIGLLIKAKTTTTSYKYTGTDLLEAHKNGYVVGFQVGRRTNLTHSEGYKNIPIAPGDFVEFVMNDNSLSQ